jgi:nitrate/nitrite transporter NarK
VLSALSWLLIFFKVHEPELPGDAQPKPGFMQALQGFGSLLLLPHTWGIVLLGMVSYASFLTVRGLWLSPMLMDRYQFSLVTTGNVALACSVISLFVPSMFGRLDPGPARRRQRIARLALLMAGIFVALALVHQSVGSVVLLMAEGYERAVGLRHADLCRCALLLPTGHDGTRTVHLHHGHVSRSRTHAVAVGLVAGVAERQNADIYQAVMLMIAAMLGSGVLAYRVIKPSPLLHKASN